MYSLYEKRIIYLLRQELISKNESNKVDAFLLLIYDKCLWCKRLIKLHVQT